MKQKAAFVYDKWLSSLGGGEVVACNIATALRDKGYQTTFIGGQLIDPDLIKQKLGIDMTGINFIQAFNDEVRIKELTKNSEIFVNASFWDYTLSSSKKQIYYTSFPSKTQSKSIKSNIKLILQDYLSKLIVPIEKTNDHQYILYSLKPKKKYQVNIVFTLSEFSKTKLSQLSLTFPNSTVLSQKVEAYHSKNQVSFTTHLLTNTQSIIIDLSFPDNCQVEVKSLFLSSRLAKLQSFIRSGSYPDTIKRVRDYDLVLANSNFTSKWIQNYWNTSSTVLYPPVKFINSSTTIKKKNQICNVGRFFTLGHGKKQEVMIEAFKRLCDSGVKDWQLHLAGGLGSEPSSQKYATHLKNISKSYPIFLHFNQSREFIENLYQSSKIYWHAAGFGENQETSPIKCEHFGITPIEALSADCVPILYNGGGLSETIKLLELDPKLHLFSTIDQLCDQTKSIITRKITLPTATAKKVRDLFSTNQFKDTFTDLLEKLK